MRGFKRVIVEVTNRCNLNCSMCLRRSWNESEGNMSGEVFSKFLADLSGLTPPPEIFFGGYGEPLSHPRILEMIQQVSSLGCRTSLITNGSTLTSSLVTSLIESGLQKLWISNDTSHQEALGQLAVGIDQPHLFNALHDIQHSGNGDLQKLETGLAFVLSNENQSELLRYLENGLELGLKSFFITNLEAYSQAQAALLPYNPSQLRQPGVWRREYGALIEELNQIRTAHPAVVIEGVLTQKQDRCPFAERGDLVLRWDGAISPCLPLLYGRRSFIGSWEHSQLSYSPGNIAERSMSELWDESEYAQLRTHLLQDDFSPCLSCRDCWLSDDNLRDCMGFTHPTCGGCLWAAGLVNCP